MHYKKILTTVIAAGIIGLPNIVHAASTTDFEDLSKEAPHYDAVMNLLESNAISGYEDGTFKPNKSITRKHIAAILSKQLDLSVPENMEAILGNYDDVDVADDYAENIAAVTDAEIFKGNDGLFHPNEPISREQAATILNRSFALNELEVKKVDINMEDVDDPHKKSVQILANNGITKNLDDFEPRKRLTRGQFASFLNRTLDELDKQENWKAVNFSKKEQEDLQKEVDEGHQPGLLDAKQVAREFIEEMDEIEVDESKDSEWLDDDDVKTVQYALKDEKIIQLELIQPIREDATGIYVVSKYRILNCKSL